jgi:hypothetical protein
MRHLILPAIMLVLTLTSCEMIIDIPLPDHEPQLVLLGHLSPDIDWEVHVSTTVGLNSVPARPVGHQNATVEIWSTEGLVTVLEHAGDGVYRAVDVRPEIGVGYTVRAKATGLPTASAAISFPRKVPFEVASQILPGGSQHPGGPSSRLQIAITFRDPPGERNFYRLEVDAVMETPAGEVMMYPTWFRLDDQSLADDFWNDDPFGQGQQRVRTAYFRDTRFEGADVEITFSIDLHGRPGDQPADFLIRLGTLSADYYTYRQTVELQRRTHDNPFAEPVQIHTNVTGGRGLVAGFSEFGRWLSGERAGPQ